MKMKSSNLSQLLGFYALLGGALVAGPQAEAYTNMNMGLNINSGGGYYGGAPMFGYGGGAGSFGALQGCFGQPNGLGGYANAGLPPPPALIPPHLQGGGYWGHGMAGSPYLQNGGGCTTYCQPTYPYAQAGMNLNMASQHGLLASNQGYLTGQQGYAQNSGGSSGGSGSNVYSIAGGGTTVIDMRTKVEDNTGDVIWAAALGMGMQAPNIYPYTGDRNGPSNFGPFFYNEGDRAWNLQERPHAGP